jgi:CheY-like chemotaxis protein
MHILIIDDTESSRELLGRFLRKHSYKISYASNGREALDLLCNAQPGAPGPRPDLILLDIMMPVMDGIEFLSHLRASSECVLANVPVIVVSASSDARMMQRANELGVGDYLVKSKFSITSLLERISEVLGRGIGPASSAGEDGDLRLSRAG